MKEPTPQQQDAISARDSSIIVSAAAGSGKTAVLTERLVRLLADEKSGVRADRIVIVTFTNDAAAELKLRLESKLRERIEANQGSAGSYLIKQQTLLQNARISTINAFCFDFIREHISEIGNLYPEQSIVSGFSVLDENNENVLKSNAMEDLLNYYSKEEYQTLSRLYDAFCMKDEKALVNVIREADKFLASAAMREKWLETAVNEYKKEFTDSIYYRKLKQMCIENLKEALEDINSSNFMIDKYEVEGNCQKMRENAEKDVDRINQLLREMKKDFPDKDTVTALCKFGNTVKFKKGDYSEKIRNKYTDKRNGAKKLAKTCLKLFSSESEYKESGEITELLAEVLKKYHELIWERKCEKNALSFDDSERLTLELLIDYDDNGNIIQSAIAEKASEYYDMIMIDEYQDSNNKQDLIFKLLSRNYRHDEKGQPMYGSNVFLVGDVKQSIYGFRLANPKNFISTMKSSQPYSENSKCKNQSIMLNRNFRSSLEVIRFVNYVFRNIMSSGCGDIDYTEDEQLNYREKEYEELEESRKTHIAFIRSDSPEDEDNAETDSEENENGGNNGEETESPISSGINPEAVYTAEKIASMLKEMPCSPSDFCILVRNNNQSKAYVDELEARGIPAKGSEEKGYLKSREISVLLNLLRIIANPLLDVPIAAVMTSPMYMFTIQQLAEIKAADKTEENSGSRKKRPVFSILRDISEGIHDDRIDSSLKMKCTDFLESLDAFRLDSITMTIGELISSVYDTTDFISVMQLYSDGEKKRANLRLLIQYAKEYETSTMFEGSGGLSGFLRHIDRISGNDRDYAQGRVSASSGNYVTVQTLHKSKGLEYPFVFIAEASTNFRFSSSPAMFSADSMTGYIFYDKENLRKYKTFQHDMIYREKKQEIRSEEMRLRYVGLTRAKQQLFINISCKKQIMDDVQKDVQKCIEHNGDIYPLVCKARNFSQWIFDCLMIHEKFADIADGLKLDCDIPEYICNNNVFDYEIWEYAGNTEKAEESAIKEAAADENTVQELESIINFGYDRELSETPAKLSVTEITKAVTSEEESDLKLKRPKFISTSSALTGAERGTAIHTFFQYCDFENAAMNPETEISRMYKLGYISKIQAESIDKGNVSAFFESRLYSRIKNSRNYIREKKFMTAVSQLKYSNEVMERFRNSDVMIKGIIDLMFEEPDGIVIVDYKSDRGISAEAMRRRYTVQIQLYRAAVELITGRKVKGAYLYSFELRKEISII